MEVYSVFQVNDLIMYAAHGVCRVEEIAPAVFSGKPTEKDYYTLRPIYESGATTIYVPVDSPAAMRRVIVPEEARLCLSELPQTEPPILSHRNARLLTAQYTEIMRSHDFRQLLLLLRSIRMKEAGLEGSPHKLGATDRKFYAKAEALVCCELAATLEVTPEEARKQLEKALSGTAIS